MPEEYIPPSGPVLEIIPEPEVLPPYIPPVRKKFPLLLSLLLILLVFMASISIYLFVQVRALNQELTASPTPFPLASADPTLGWQTYRVDGIELRIPDGWNNLTSACQSINIAKSDVSQLNISIKDYIKKEAGFSDITKIDELISQVDPRYIIPFKNIPEEDIVTLGPLGIGEINNIYIKGPEGYYTIQVMYVGPETDSDNLCTGAKELDYQQVLSTLKFGHESGNSASYICPKTEYVDCMPGPNQGVKQECTSEYLTWASTNCPGFKGAAL